MKKLRSVVFLMTALTLCLCLFASVPAQAAGDVVTYAVEGGNIYFNTLSRTVTRCDRSVTVADIPTSINGVPVYSIGDWAFEFCSGLKSVTIPEGVTSIGNSAFYGCVSLKSATIPASVKTIGTYAFYGCTSLNTAIPSGITSIGQYAFYGCVSLKSVTIPVGITSIGKYAFADCDSLAGVTIPEGVTTLGSSTFSGCDALKSVTIPSSLTKIGDDVFSNCVNLVSVTIPKGVTAIGWHAFIGCRSLTNITLPSSITEIGSSAFQNCSSLTGLTVPSGVTKLYDSAFSGCSALTTVTIPSGIGQVVGGTFYRCSDLKSISIPNGITGIGDEAFYGCSSLKSIGIPASVSSIGSGAFQYCYELTDVYYAGTREQWSKVRLGAENSCLQNAAIHYNSTMPQPTVDPFTDVLLSAYYAGPVSWAVKEGVTTGTSATAFSPDLTCTNAQILTFLWRASGEPAVSIANPFTNVKESAYYYKAALWAYSNGMVPGGSFDADGLCTRASTVKFIWQAAGSPAVTARTGFTDVPAGADYAAAVSWAVEKGVTTGTGAATFSPNMTCTRAQIVTFLYRALTNG